MNLRDVGTLNDLAGDVLGKLYMSYPVERLSTSRCFSFGQILAYPLMTWSVLSSSFTCQNTYIPDFNSLDQFSSPVDVTREHLKSRLVWFLFYWKPLGLTFAQSPIRIWGYSGRFRKNGSLWELVVLYFRSCSFPTTSPESLFDLSKYFSVSLAILTVSFYRK